MNELKDEALAVFEKSDKPSYREIKALMKKSGKSFAQVVKETNAIRRKIAAAKAQAQEKGEPFSERAFLKQMMEKASAEKQHIS